MERKGVRTLEVNGVQQKSLVMAVSPWALTRVLRACFKNRALKAHGFTACGKTSDFLLLPNPARGGQMVAPGETRGKPTKTPPGHPQNSREVVAPVPLSAPGALTA